MYLVTHSVYNAQLDGEWCPVGIYTTEAQAELHIANHLIKRLKVVQYTDLDDYKVYEIPQDAPITMPTWDTEVGYDHYKVFKAVAHIKGQKVGTWL